MLGESLITLSLPSFCMFQPLTPALFFLRKASCIMCFVSKWSLRYPNLQPLKPNSGNRSVITWDGNCWGNVLWICSMLCSYQNLCSQPTEVSKLVFSKVASRIAQHRVLNHKGVSEQQLQQNNNIYIVKQTQRWHPSLKQTRLPFLCSTAICSFRDYFQLKKKTSETKHTQDYMQRLVWLSVCMLFVQTMELQAFPSRRLSTNVIIHHKK